LAKIDTKLLKKGSNDDRQHPYESDARITKIEDGRMHLAHKAEHAVDLNCGAVVAGLLHKANAGDAQTLLPTLEQAAANVDGQPGVVQPIQEVVTDKGYHSRHLSTTMAMSGLCRVLFAPLVADTCRVAGHATGRHAARAVAPVLPLPARGVLRKRCQSHQPL
jgi:hypothetical protein